MNQSAPNSDNRTVITIPKEKAVFWMDGQGCWHNRHGPFEHKRLIAHFNASIGKDKDGYYVAQANGDIIEKVYFPYQVTALFAVDIVGPSPVKLLLNTGKQLQLSPERLYIYEDQLYMRHGRETIKFAQQALLKLSKGIEFEHGTHWLTLGGKRYKLPESIGTGSEWPGGNPG